MRKSNFETLRILAMLGIVLAHIIGWSPNVASMFESPSKQTLFLTILSPAGKIGVLLFIMITGFFLCKKDFHFGRIKRTAIETISYSIVVSLTVMLLSHTLSLSSAIESIFPLNTNIYWFPITYIVIILLMPALNLIAAHFTKRKFRRRFFAITLAFFTLNTIGKYLDFNLEPSGTYRILTYAFAYLTGAALAMSKRLQKTPRSYRIAFMILGLATFATSRFVKVYILRQQYIDLWVGSESNIFSYLVATSIFFLFESINIPQSKIINAISASTFAVYLIAENPFLRPYIYEQLTLSNYFGSRKLYVMTFIYTAIIFSTCVACDFCLKKLSSKTRQLIATRKEN